MNRLLLLADADTFLHLGDRFRVGQTSFGAGAVLLVLTVGISVAAIVWLLKRWTQRREEAICHSPRQLWHDLCRAHGITWSEARLLRSVSRQQKLADPCLLFVEPAFLSQSLALPALRRHAHRLQTLRERLFST